MNSIGHPPCEFCGAANCYFFCTASKAKQRHDELASERAAGRRDERANILEFLKDIDEETVNDWGLNAVGRIIEYLSGDEE